MLHVFSVIESMVSRAQVKEDGFYVCLLQGKGIASSGESRVLLGKSRLLECLAISINSPYPATPRILKTKISDAFSSSCL